MYVCVYIRYTHKGMCILVHTCVCRCLWKPEVSILCPPSLSTSDFWICKWPWSSLSGPVPQVNVLLSLCLQYWGYRHWLTFFLYEWWRSELSSLGLPSKHFTNSPAPGFFSLLLEGDDLVFTVIQVSSEGMAKNICFPFLSLWVLSLIY